MSVLRSVSSNSFVPRRTYIISIFFIQKRAPEVFIESDLFYNFEKYLESMWKNPGGHKSTFKFYQMESFEKLNIDNSKVNYVEFIGPLLIFIEAPVTVLVWTWGTSKLFLSKLILEKVNNVIIENVSSTIAPH